MAVDSHRHRHVLDLEFVNGFHAQVVEAQNAGALDSLRHEVGGTTNCHQVNGAVVADGLDRLRATLRFADHAEQAGVGKHVTREGVHTRGRGRAGGSDDFVTDRIDRADVVDEAACEIDGQRFATLQHVGHALVCGIAAGKQLAIEQQDFTRLPCGNFFASDGIEIDAAGCRNVVGERRPVFE